MSGSILSPYRWQVFYNGSPASGAKLYSFLSGTATPQALYSDSALTTPYSPQPVTADADGVFPIMYMAAVAYRITITTSTGTTIFAATDNIYDLYQVFTATTQTANTIFSGPSTGAPAAPTFRALVAADMPTLSAANMPTGSVIQVVGATYATVNQSTSSTYADTGLTASITPRSTSNKILALVSQAGLQNTVGSSTSLKLQLLRTATVLGEFSKEGATASTANIHEVGSAAFNYLDSPASASALTYKTQMASSDNASAVRCQQGSAVSSIILMEIVG